MKFPMTRQGKARRRYKNLIFNPHTLLPHTQPYLNEYAPKRRRFFVLKRKRAK